MLGRTAGNVYWMFRYLERAENIARLIEAGFQIALASSNRDDNAWQSVVTTAALDQGYFAKYDNVNADDVIDYLLRDQSNPSSVYHMLEQARDNARSARTALTREVWEAVNSTWLVVQQEFKRPIKTRDLPARLDTIRQQTALVRGAVHGTMLRHHTYDFMRLGSQSERFQSTARILDVKYYVLLPTASHVGSSIDNIQWQTILRSVSAYQSYNWLYRGKIDAGSIVDYLVFDHRFPRSMSYALKQVKDHLDYLTEQYGKDSRAADMARTLHSEFETCNRERVFDIGLHEFLQNNVSKMSALAEQVETDYRFYA